MTRLRLVLMLSFFMAAHKAACQTLSKAILKSMKTCHISTKLIRVIKILYDNATSAVLFNSSIGEQQLESDRNVCSHPPSSTYIWKRIITDALEGHEGTVSIGGRTNNNLLFADDINGLAGEEELAKLVERLDRASKAYHREISAEKTKLMTTPVVLTQSSK